MTGKKRTRNGDIKSAQPLKDIAASTTEPTPPCAQPLASPSKSANAPQKAGKPPLQQDKNVIQRDPVALDPEVQKNNPTPHVSNPRPKHNSRNRQKLQKLPSNVTISKRPLLHPALPTPFASSSFPKVVYITATTPYLSCVKRIRKLLTEIRKRETQSDAARWTNTKRAGNARANGRLDARDVERDIADAVALKPAGGGGKGRLGGGQQNTEREQVYLKATGRAIPRALEIGLHFQADEECRVQVEMGSVSAIDDIEVRGRPGESGERESDIESKGGQKEEEGDQEEIPESRIRTLSSLTVSIGMN